MAVIEQQGARGDCSQAEGLGQPLRVPAVLGAHALDENPPGRESRSAVLLISVLTRLCF